MAYVINRGEYESIESHWIPLRLNGDNVACFDSLRVKCIPKEIKKSIGNKNITTNIYITQANVSIMYDYFCVGFIDFMLKGKS